MISESSSEDEIMDYGILRRPRIFRDRTNPFDVYDEIDFKSRFRFNKDTVHFLYEHIEPSLKTITERNEPINPMQQILCTLRFYGTGAFQTVLGDHVNISKASVCRILKKVTSHIVKLKPMFINMPQEQTVNTIKREFYEIGNGNVIGATDCTHVRLKSPGRNNAELFRNRKGYFSINVQAVCDAKLRFLNIIVRWPGSVHDSRIFNDSPLKHELENNMYPNSYLLGVNGYPCRNYLLTPILNPQTAAEQNYNTAHIRTRNTIERAFGVLKQRFPCIAFGLRLKMETNLAVIVACFVFHNLAIFMKDDPIEDILLPQDFNLNADIILQNNNNNTVRRTLTNTIFA